MEFLLINVRLLLLKPPCIAQQPCLFIIYLRSSVCWWVCNFKQRKWWVVVFCVKFNHFELKRNMKVKVVKVESSSSKPYSPYLQKRIKMQFKRTQKKASTFMHAHLSHFFTRFVRIPVLNIIYTYVSHNSRIHDLVLILHQYSEQTICQGITICNNMHLYIMMYIIVIFLGS